MELTKVYGKELPTEKQSLRTLKKPNAKRDIFINKEMYELFSKNSC